MDFTECLIKFFKHTSRPRVTVSGFEKRERDQTCSWFRILVSHPSRRCNEVQCACRVDQEGNALPCVIDTCEIDDLPHEIDASTKHHDFLKLFLFVSNSEKLDSSSTTLMVVPVSLSTHERAAVSLTTSVQLFSCPSIVVPFSHVHAQSRTKQDVRHSLRCDQLTLIGTFVVLLLQPRELLQLFDPMAPNIQSSRTAGESEIQNGLPVRGSSDVWRNRVNLISRSFLHIEKHGSVMIFHQSSQLYNST